MLGKTALVIGGSRGLGNALVHELSLRGITNLYVTIRSTLNSTSSPSDSDSMIYPDNVKVIENVDLTSEGGGSNALEKGLKKEGAVPKFDLVIYSAGLLKPDSLTKLSWKDQIDMYATCSISPVFIIAKLLELKAFPDYDHSSATSNEDSSDQPKVLLITSEGGSITLRTPEEGGSNYGHHGSKAASNMIGKLLSFDLAKLGITVLNLHPGFMRTEMTHGAGYSQYWDSGGAVEPKEAAVSLLNFASTVTMKMSGRFFAPRGPRDIGEAERVMGKNLPTPLELPW